MALNSLGSSSFKFLLSPSFTIDWPKGCSDALSIDAAILNNSFSSIPFVDIISVNSGSPFVIVPVLSNTMVSILWVISKCSPDFIKIPCSAAFPVPTIIAVGVASPRAHGQAITSTATEFIIARLRSP